MGNDNQLKLPPIKKSQYFFYGMGDLGNNIAWGVSMAFISVYYTDVFGVNPGILATLFLVGRFWDAINDPLIGTLADHTKTKWGTYKPWIAISAAPLAVSMILLFSGDPTWDEVGKTIYAYITYFIIVLAYTCISVPYGSLLSRMTNSPHERNVAASFRNFMGTGMYTVATTIFPFIVAFFAGPQGDQVAGYQMAAVLLACIAVPCQLLCAKFCKERIDLPKPKKGTQSWAKTVPKLFKNGPLMACMIANIAFGFSMTGKATCTVYFWMYNYGDYGMYPTYNLLNTGIMLAGVALAPIFCAKLFKGFKGRQYWVCAFVNAICCLICFLIPISAETLPAFFVFTIIGAVFNGLALVMLYSTIPDALDYHEWKFGQRVDGVGYAFVGLMMKVGMAIGQFVPMMMLAAFGYVAGGVQNESSLWAINFGMNGLGFIMYAAAGAAYLFYKLTPKRFAEITADLDKKHAEAAEKA